mgnify:FL=1
MKKILQRIGLLAMAGMLLWGWQGMEANAAVTADTITRVRDYTKLGKWDFGYNLEHCKLNCGRSYDYGTGCDTPYSDHYHYVIYIEPEDGYCFAINAPEVTADIKDNAGNRVETITLNPIERSSATTRYGYEVCSLIDKTGQINLHAEAENLDLNTKFIENEILNHQRLIMFL